MESAICTRLGLLLSLNIMLVGFIPVAYGCSLFIFTAERCSLCLYCCLSLCLVDGPVDGSHLGSYRMTVNTSVPCPGDTCMHFCWVNNHPGVGVLGQRV